MGKLFFILSSIFLPLISIAQDFGSLIKENAIEIKKLESLDDNIYESISDYNLIMVGEMHGTKEPAKFVESLSKLILKNEESVSVGIEVPKEEMLNFIDSPSVSSLRESRFFKNENIDGRNGQSWFDLIVYCISDTNINLFFYDNYPTIKNEPRDSIMYLGIRNQKINYPKSKIITLSGNVHNMKVAFNNTTTMGMYCRNDSVNFDAKRICSINHTYSKGGMLNNIGNGLELTTIDFKENIFSKSSEFKNYLIFYDFSKEDRYDGILYTETVNPSKDLERR